MVVDIDLARSIYPRHSVPKIIFCPTRDRPKILRKTLTAIQKELRAFTYQPVPTLYVIDDSTQSEHRAKNKRIVGMLGQGNFFYHGRDEQKEILHRLSSVMNKSIAVNLSRFIRPLGQFSWDLGAVRNYILLLATIKQTAIIITLDDDVALKKGSLAILIKAVKNNPNVIAGGDLQGAPDASLIERMLLRQKKYQLPKRHISISGGLLAFSSHWAKLVPFPRTYNEDWIWMVGCSILGAKLLKTNARAIHLVSSRLFFSKEQTVREITGEAFFEGWNWAYRVNGLKRGCFKTVKDLAYWADILKHELAYARRLQRKYGIKTEGVKRNASRMNNIFSEVISELKSMAPKRMLSLAHQYIGMSKQWEKLSTAISQNSKVGSVFQI